MKVLAIDPGKEKCGLSVVDKEQGALHREICLVSLLLERITHLIRRFSVDVVLLGNKTGCGWVQEKLREKNIHFILADEHKSTEKGRALYFQMCPPKGWRKLIPRTLRTPPEPYDDFAALVLAKEYLQSL